MPEAIIQSLLEIEEMISTEKKKIVDINALIETLNLQRSQLEEKCENDLQSLEKEHKRTIERLEAEQESIKQEIKETDERTSALSNTYKSKIEKITEKISALKNARLGYIEDELNEKINVADEDLKHIETLTEEFVAKKNNYAAKYNKEINSIDEQYRELRHKEAAIKAEIVNTRKKLVKEKEELIKKLNKEKESLEKKNKGIISEAKRANEEKIREIEAKQTYIINKRKEELVELKEQSRVVSIEKDKLIKENIDTQNKMAEEINLAEKRFAQKIELLNKENEKLRNELFDVENSMMKATETNTNELQKKKDEYQEYLKFLGERKKAKIEELNEKLLNSEAQKKEKLSSFINNLDEKYNELVVSKNKVIDTLNQQLAEETKKLDDRIAKDNELIESKNNDYKNELNRIETETEEQRIKTTSIIDNYEVKIKEMEEELAMMENNNKAELEKLTAEYDFLLQESKLKHEKKCSELREKVDETNSKITELNNDVEDVKNDLKSFVELLSNKREILVKNHNENLDRIANEKQRLNDRIQEVQRQMIEDAEKQKNAIEELNNQRNKSLEEFNKTIEDLENSHKEDMKRIHLENQNRIEAAKANYEERAKQLEVDTKQLKENIEREIENKKKDYAEQNEILANLNVQLKDEFDKRVEASKTLRESLLQKIDVAKKEYEDSLATFNETRAQIIARLNIESNKLKEDQLQKLREMVITYEVQPAQELEAARKELEIRTIEYDKEVESIQIERERCDKEYKELEETHKAIRNEAEETLKDVEKTYKNFVIEKEDNLQRLNTDLQHKKDEIEAQNERLKKDIQDIKDNHIVEEKNLSEQLELQYEEVKKALQTKHDVISRQYEQEIDAYKNDLAVKLKDYDDMIAEASKKRTKLEEEYSIKFDDEDKKTKNIQKQLDDQLENNLHQSAEWKRLLAVKKDEIDSQLANVKEQYNQIIEEKRAEYEKHIDDIKDKIENIKKEMIGFDADKEAKLTELTAFKNRVDSEIASIKSVTDDVVSKVASKTNELARDAAALEATYNQKENSIKRQIDETIKELLALEKARPTVIKDEVDFGANQLLIKTQDFKEKLAELNKSNQEILNKLELAKKQTIDNISFEISELVSGKRDSLNAHTEELENIVRTYEKLLRDEKQRQISIEDQIRKAKMEKVNEYNKFINENEAVSNDYVDKKKLLEKEFNNKSEELNNDYKPQVVELTKELLNLESNKTVVISDIKDIKSQYDKKSDELEETKTALLKEYADKMKDINESYEEAINENREKLKSDDAINGVILDIFKK